jgi:hypothetical protein
VLPEHGQREATPQVVRWPIETVFIAQELEQIERETFL